MAVETWINCDETAKQMLGRVSRERPFLLLPPLHRVPLRVGNVVEIVGPSPSAKTEILIQAAITCVLPKEWNGVNYGGFECLVMYFDLDCRFDIGRFSHSLRHRILQSSGTYNKVNLKENNLHQQYNDNNASGSSEELFIACMRRFLYVRCYSSAEFLATLKTSCYQLQKESEAHGIAARFLMIDSISAFYWVDRASTPVSVGSGTRKILSFHGVVETVAQEIRKLLQVQPMLVLATKATLSAKLGTADLGTVKDPQKHPYREYMPSTWQLFITHRMFVQASSDKDLDGQKHLNQPTYVSQWLQPSLSFSDKFIVSDGGIFTVK